MAVFTGQAYLSAMPGPAAARPTYMLTLQAAPGRDGVRSLRVAENGRAPLRPACAFHSRAAAAAASPGRRETPPVRRPTIMAYRTIAGSYRRPRAAQPEQQIQRAVFEHLALRGASTVFAFHPANGGWRSCVEAAILKGMGVRAGVPDIVAIKGGPTRSSLKGPAAV
jgi:hypothetical protein